jgi:CubicO group peptidase (beta-lactamase class C family)
MLAWSATVAMPVVAACAQTQPPDATRMLSIALDSIVRAELTRTSAPGAQLAIVRKNRVILSRAYGIADRSVSAPMTAETRIPIGSITKSFTSAAALREVASGTLRLDASVAEFFPGRTLDPAVTVRHLLNHTSGLKPYEQLIPQVVEFSRTVIRPDTVLGYIAAAPMDFRPGTRWAYSNTNYHLLGLILERVTGRAFFDVVTARAATTPALLATGPCGTRARSVGRAVGYEPESGGLEESTLPSVNLSYAAGGLCSTAAELATWFHRLPEFVTDTYFRAMIAPTVLPSGTSTSYGLGFAIGELAGHRWFGHGGSLPGFDGFAAHYPDDSLTVVVLANMRPFDSEGLHKRLVRRVLMIAEPVIIELALTAEQRRQFAGTYGVSGRSLRVIDGSNGLQLVGPGDFTLAFQGKDTFVAREDPDIRLEYVREDGRVVGMVYTAPGRRIELRKLP